MAYPKYQLNRTYYSSNEMVELLKFFHAHWCELWRLKDFIHYSFAPLILFCVPYTLDLLLCYLSTANGTGGVGIFELLVFQCFV